MKAFMKFYNVGPFRLVLRKRRIITTTSRLIKRIIMGQKLIEAQLGRGKFSIALQFWRNMDMKVIVCPKCGKENDEILFSHWGCCYCGFNKPSLGGTET